MRKAALLLYTLFLLTFVSQVNYSETGNFLYAGISNSQSVQNEVNYKGSSFKLGAFAKATKHTNPKSLIRIKALNENAFLAGTTFHIRILSFPTYTLFFSFYKSYKSDGTHGSNLLRGPPIYTA